MIIIIAMYIVQLLVWIIEVNSIKFIVLGSKREALLKLIPFYWLWYLFVNTYESLKTIRDK